MKSAVFGILAVVLVLGITGTLANGYGANYGGNYKAYSGHHVSQTLIRAPYPVPYPLPAPGQGGFGNDGGLFGGQGFGLFFILILVLLLNNNNSIG